MRKTSNEVRAKDKPNKIYKSTSSQKRHRHSQRYSDDGDKAFESPAGHYVKTNKKNMPTDSKPISLSNKQKSIV